MPRAARRNTRARWPSRLTCARLGGPASTRRSRGVQPTDAFRRARARSSRPAASGTATSRASRTVQAPVAQPIGRRRSRRAVANAREELATVRSRSRRRRPRTEGSVPARWVSRRAPTVAEPVTLSRRQLPDEENRRFAAAANWSRVWIGWVGRPAGPAASSTATMSTRATPQSRCSRFKAAVTFPSIE